MREAEVALPGEGIAGPDDMRLLPKVCRNLMRINLPGEWGLFLSSQVSWVNLGYWCRAPTF